MTTPAELVVARKAVADRILGGKRFLITSHRNPDGDAIGSALALRGLIEKTGRQATVLVRDSWAPQFARIPGIERVQISERLPDDYPDGWDALFTMECPEHERCGYPILPGPVINIDHHPGNTLYGEINLLDIDAPSVGEMLLALREPLGVELDAEIATAIYVSLATDTGFFRYMNTTLRALECAVELVRAGAVPGEISLWINETTPVRALQLQALCMSTLEIHHGGLVSTMELQQKFLDQTGATAEDSDGLSSLGRTIEGVIVAALFREVSGGTRVSLRAKPGADVRVVAGRFGGGGHVAASGCFVPAPVPQAKQQILELIEEMLSSRSEEAGRVADA